MALDVARRPAGRQRRAAVGAEHEAAQREVGVEVLPLGQAVDARQTVLDAPERLVADQALMLAGPSRHVPVRGFHVARVAALVEHVGDALAVHPSGPVLGEQRVRLEEAHDVGLGLEAAGGVALEAFSQDGGDGLDALQHHAAAGHPLVAVAQRRLEHPVAVEHARAHAVPGLLAVLLALVLGDAGEQVLDQQRVGVLAELDGGRLQRAAGAGDEAAQLEVRLQPAREAGHVVDDGDDALRAALADGGQHGLHAGPVDKAPGHVVLEHVGDGVAFAGREVPAAGFLRAQAVAVLDLLDAGRAAVDDRLFLGTVAHVVSSRRCSMIENRAHRLPDFVAAG